MAPGRTFSASRSGVHHAFEPLHGYHKLEKHRFAKEIADVLYSAAHRGQYSKLVIAAPPMIMGDLRKAFHKEVSEKVVAEVSKDLTNLPAHEIERILAGDANKGV